MPILHHREILTMEREALLSKGSVNGNVVENGDTYNNTTDSKDHTFTRYKRRWYILVLFTLIPATQNIIWSTWGPLTSSAELAFGWQNGDIAFLSNWGPITFIISAFFFSWMMDVKGLRLACVISGGLVCVGAGLRCITSEPPAATWLIHTGQMLNGFAGPVAMAAPPLLSSKWFPAEQRTTSTAFTSLVAGLGGLIGALITPLVVKDFSHLPRNNTASNTTTPTIPLFGNNGSNTNSELIQMQRSEIMKLMYIEFGLAAAVFLALLVYFPDRPPTPPSVTAHIQREGFKDGLKGLIRKKQFWLLCIPYSLGCGVYYCWASVININTKPFGIRQNDIDTMVFYAGLPGIFSNILVGRFADVFARHMKAILIVNHTLGCAAIAWMTLCILKVLPMNLLSLYIIMITAGIAFGSSSPLLFELSCENSYPIGEGLTTGFLTWLANITGFVFLLVLMIPNIGTLWMNWAFFGCIVVCLVSLALFKGHYNRLDRDKNDD